MEKLIHFLEILLIPTLSIIAFLISIADFFGLLGGIPWLSSARITIMTLLVGSLALGSLSILQSKQRTLHQSVDRILTESIMENTRKQIERIDPDLLLIFKENFLKQFETFQTAVNKNLVEVQGKHEYEYFYIRTLQKYEQATFLATTFSNETYLWGNPRMKDAFARFIVNGGKIIRVFFLKNAQELALPEIQAILTEQHKMKVDVYTIDWSLLTDDLRHVFVVESKGRLAWYASVPVTGDPITRVSAIATTNDHVTKKYLDIFYEISERAQRFIP